jgi:glycine/sarcosine N-methyltransferase
MNMSTIDFYDRPAPYFHLLFPEWEVSIQRQGVALASVLADAGLRPGATVLDAACGVGTQALGLAARDNALPHLLTDAELGAALRECYRCTAPGGVAIFSVRDYAAIERKSPDVRPYGVK